MFRPAPMAWVDLLVDRDSIAAALEVLGRLRVIELRRYDRAQTPFEVSAQPELLARLAALARELDEVAAILPPPDPAAVAAERRALSTERVIDDLQRRCGDWLRQARPLAARLREVGTRLEELELLARGLDALPPAEFDPSLLAADPAQRFPPFVALGSADDLDLLNDPRGRIIGRAYPLAGAADAAADRRVLVVGVTAADALGELERRFHGRGLRFVRVPAGLAADGETARRQARALLAAERAAHERLLAELEQLNRRGAIAGELWLLRRHLWINESLADSLTGKRFVWLGGWVPQRRYAEMLDGLHAGGVAFLANRDTAQDHGAPPVQLDNPRWIRRFEAFVRGFGVPAADELDPSPLLAVMTPLMFGYMFGDVGQGAVLIVIGYVARRYLPILELLIAGGISSVAFGFLYGSLFADEHILPALWVRPMDEPLWMLAVPIAFGFLVILASLLFAALQAAWRGVLRRWWAFEAPITALYLALPVALLAPAAALVLGLAALAWLLAAVGRRAWREKGPAAVPAALLREIAGLLEIAFQLAINTLSFARLGAFALAHAGLSAAVIALAAMPESLLGKAIVLVLGNVLVIALEGLVVSIQTTRLVMFEFFRRFLVGEGRPFHPLTLPDNGRLAS